MAEQSASHQHIDTNQPRPLRGLKLRGRKSVETVTCEGPSGGRQMIVNVDDYDKKLHGAKCAKDKLPTRAKKKAKKKAEDADE
jgi:hypothetical protein